MPDFRAILLSAVVAASFGCGGDATPLDQCFEPTVDVSVCDPAGTFTVDATNPYFPLVVGTQIALEGEEDGEMVRVEIEVLDETEVVGGVTTRVASFRELVDGELEEEARDLYAEAADGTVCYFGEDVDNYENGQIADHEGSWRAENGNHPGIIMPATPAVGQAFFQERAPGVALDMSRVTELGGTLTAAGQTFDDVVTLLDSNPLEGTPGCEAEEEKRYAAGVGPVSDEAKVLVSFTPGN